MPLIQLESFGGQAEILGTSKGVYFAAESLTINGVTIAEARMLLEILSTGQIKGTQLFDAARAATNDLLETSRAAAIPRPTGRASGVAAAAASAVSAMPEQEPVPAATPAPAAAAPAAPSSSNGGGRAAAETKSAPEAKADKPAKAVRATAAKPEPAEETTDAPAETKAAPTKAAAKAPASTSAPADEDALIEMISKKSRLRDIVTALHEAGPDYDSAPKILAACERMLERVPVLKRAADLNVRIPKIAASFGIPV